METSASFEARYAPPSYPTRAIALPDNRHEAETVACEYKAAFTGPDAVAVKLNQTEIHAPEHATWGTVVGKKLGASL